MTSLRIHRFVAAMLMGTASLLTTTAGGSGRPSGTTTVDAEDPPSTSPSAGRPEEDHSGTLIHVAADPGQEEARGRVPVGIGTTGRLVMLCNVHSRPVELAITRSSCGCVKPSLARQIVQPGDAVPLDLIIDVGDLPGPQRHGVEVRATSSGPDGELVEEFQVTVSYTPDLKIVAIPRWIVRRTLAHVSDAWEYSIAQRFPGRFQPPDPTISIDWIRSEPTVPSAKNPWVRRGRLSGAAPSVGVFNGGLTIALGEPDSSDVFVVPVTVQAIAPWRSDPPGWVVDGSPSDLPLCWEGTITARDPKAPTPATVRVDASLDGLKAELVQADGRWHVRINRDATSLWQDPAVALVTVADDVGRTLAEFRIVRIPPIP